MRTKQKKGCGKVFLVGAGPGDPSLITVKAKRLLKSADVIVYDNLMPISLIAFAKKGAKCISVGKSAGSHSLPQDEINRLLVSEARKGNSVVRLKGGDPFVFGRGGEEALALSAHKISYEIIPGISTGYAAPAYAGIPVTHRNYASIVAFVTGHEGERKNAPAVNWESLARLDGTIVIFMGLRQIQKNLDALIKGGKSKNTPAAIIEQGTTASQRVVVGTLSTLPALSKKHNLQSPALVVVGDVVKMRKFLKWFEKKPLFGKTIVITRHEEGAKEFSDMLEECGARCILVPTIKIVPVKENKAIKNAVKNLKNYDWVMFTSVNGVKIFFDLFKAKGIDARGLKNAKIAAIGEKTAEALEKFNIAPDLVPKKYIAEGLLAAFGKINLRGKSILIPRARGAREVLPRELKKRGAVVTEVQIYEARLPSLDEIKIALSRLKAGLEKIDAITFLSPSAVKNFVSLFNTKMPKLKNILCACIGPITEKEAKKYFSKTISAKKHTAEALTRTLARYFAG